MPKAARKSIIKPAPATPVPAFIDPAGLPPRYAMRVAGNCMAPEIDHGAVVEFDRDAPVNAGDTVIIFLRPELVPPGELQCQIKRLVLDVAGFVSFPFKPHPKSDVIPLIVLERLNPPRQFTLPATAVLAVHRCLGVIPEGSVSASGDVFTRRRFLHGAGVTVAALSGGAVALAAEGRDAAVVAAIDAHKAAEAALYDACGNQPPWDDPGMAAWSQRQEAAGLAAWDASWALLEAEPNTIGGVALMLAYLPTFMVRGADWPEGASEDGEDVSFHRDAYEWAAHWLGRLAS